MPRASADREQRKFAVMLRDARAHALTADGHRLTQDDLGRMVSISAQRISQFELGLVLSSLKSLGPLHAALTRATPVSSPMTDLSGWLLAWLEDKVLDGSDELVPDDMAAALEQLRVGGARLPSAGRVSADTPLDNLADFPGADPFTIILGDRRELSARSAGDCLIYSGSVTDSMYLALFGGNLTRAEITTDKLLARLPFARLRERAELSERNLLIIGSPAVNWATRLLNKGAVFPFRIDEDVFQRSEHLLTDDRMQNRDFASTFWKLAQSVRPGHGSAPLDSSLLDDDERPYAEDAEELLRPVLAGSTAKALMNRFRALGILDPADQENHGTNVHSDNDFAVITLARNPFARTDRYRAVICAGVHGSGTAAAVRTLATDAERFFRSRPFGGVLEVRTNTDLEWPERIPASTVRMQTQPYDVRAVLRHLDVASERPIEARAGTFRQWSDTSLQECASFVRSVVAGLPD